MNIPSRIDRSSRSGADSAPGAGLRQRRRFGGAFVEMLLVLPVLILIIVGMVEFGRAMMVGQWLSSGARHGARLAAAQGSTSTVVRQAVQEQVSQALQIDPQALHVEVEVVPAPGRETPERSLATAEPKDLVKVTVSIPYARVAYVSGAFLNETTLKGECAVRHE